MKYLFNVVLGGFYYVSFVVFYLLKTIIFCLRF